MTQIIALSGSLKSTSLNNKLVVAAERLIQDQDVNVVHVNLSDYDIPLFSEELEAEQTPSGVADLKKLFADSQGLLIANPEYNGSMTGVLKNAIDWLSRPGKDKTVGSAFAGKAAAIIATSPGALGGLRGINHTRDVLFNLGVYVSPVVAAVGGAYQAFDENGNLTDDNQQQRVQSAVDSLVLLTKALL